MNSKNPLVFNDLPLTIEDTYRKAGQQMHAKQSNKPTLLNALLKVPYSLIPHLLLDLFS